MALTKNHHIKITSPRHPRHKLLFHLYFCILLYIFFYGFVDKDVSIRLRVECASQHARLTNTKNKQHKILSGIQNTPKQDTVIPPIQPEHFCQPRKTPRKRVSVLTLFFYYAIS